MASKHNIDKEKLKRLLPKGTSHKVSDEIINLIDSMEEDTGLLQEYMEESILTHLPVLREIKVDLDDYINAIKFCNLKRSMTNEKAWEITFPDKYKKLTDRNGKVSSHVAMYNLSKIVTKIDAQMAVAEHIQYAPYRHKAIMKQYELMNGVASDGMQVSANVQHLAAKTLAELTMPPVEQKIDITIGQSDESKNAQAKMIEELRKNAENQQALLMAGHKLEDIQKLNLTIEVEEDDGEEEYTDIVEDE